MTAADSKPFLSCNPSVSAETSAIQAQKEDFAELVDPKLRFESRWALWEHYDTQDYAKAMRKVAWFDDVISFSEAWVNSQHRDIHNFFFNEETKNINVHLVDGEEKRVNGLSLFEYGINPEWEDPINEQGGEFRTDFRAPIATVQKLWEKLVFQTVTGEFSECDKLCGVRLLDKSQPGKESFFRIEVWTKFSSEHEDSGKAMREYIEQKLATLIKETEDPMILVNQTKFAQHKTAPAAGGNKGYQKSYTK